MELSSPESIRSLLAAFGEPAGVRPSRDARNTARAARRERIRCSCGRCRQCQDDARWNRIFAEKFADPAYYTRRIIHTASPLTSI
jgi:hypothetical protein